MTLKDLTTEEIKDILKQLLYKVEISKEVVDKNLKFRSVYQYNEMYCINYFDGCEYKVCSIDDLKADISSESILDNVKLTKYYQELLREIFRKKENEQALNA